MAKGQGSDRILVVFDSRCILCNRWVLFLLRHEMDSRFHFIAASSGTGRAIGENFGFSVDDLNNTYLVIEDERPLVRSDAGLALLSYLNAPWRWLRILGLIPKSVRDAAYDAVARNRIRWFGNNEQCLLPSVELESRFTLD